MSAPLIPLTSTQQAVVEMPLETRLFISGPAGCGKTTAAVERLVFLLNSGVPGQSILVFVPQRALGEPFTTALRTPGLVSGGLPDVITIGGLARRMVDLFWPLVAEPAGFAHPEMPPNFLTLETAQYYMAHVVRPRLEEGYFDSVVIDRNRLYSQIIDNLNKAAVIGFEHTQIGERLKSAWVGEVVQHKVYENAQQCVNEFRQLCLQHNLLDFSLQLEIFRKFIWQQGLGKATLRNTYRHLVADNIEENPPVASDLLYEWLPDFDSAFLVYDRNAGYRLFLGADPDEAYRLRDQCGQQVVMAESFVLTPSSAALGDALDRRLRTETDLDVEPAHRPAGSLTKGPAEKNNPADALVFELKRYYPEMLDWVTDQITDLVFNQGTPPGEIVVLAPFLSDALRFSLTYRLESLGVAVRTYRPSRALREEPITHCLLTLAAFAHPEWGLVPPRADFAHVLLQAIAGMDLVRAGLLAEIVYRTQAGKPYLSPFERINPAMQDRVTFTFGERYETIRTWLQTYQENPAEELDHFLARLFGEVLSQPGFGFHGSYIAGEVTANLIESIQKFRWTAEETLQEAGIPLGAEYLRMVQDGVIAAAYLESMQEQPLDAVFLAPAYTFLLQNRPVNYQFWLDVGNRSWYERIAQPLTHPYVLSRRWPEQKAWTQEDEEQKSQETMRRLVTGLINRCRGRIYLGLSQLNEQGFESRGPLLRALDRVLRESATDLGDRG
jgi:hypothetical protein